MCDDETPRHVAGDVDGEAFTLTVNGGGFYSRLNPALWDARARLDSDGFIHLWGYETVFGTGAQGFGQGHFFMPSAGPSAGTHYCAASVEVSRVDTFRYAAAISDFSELGRCPAQAGTDEISGCFGAAEGSPIVCNSSEARLVGTVGGVDIDESYLLNTHNIQGSSPATRLMSFGQGGLIALIGTTSASSGFIQMPSDGPSPGAIYCIGEATLLQDGSAYGFVLGELGFVGVCPGTSEVSGEATSCL